MLTKKDRQELIQDLKEVFATKDDIKKVNDNVIKFKDEILDEIVKLREDSTMDTGTRDMVEDHETRLEKIEKQLHISSSE